MILVQAWHYRASILAGALIAALFIMNTQDQDIERLEALLSAKPLVEEKLVTKIVEGPVKIVEKIIEKPGGEKIVERIITKEVVVKDSASSHVETPVCWSAPAPRWIFAASVDPRKVQQGPMLKGGTTIKNRLDLFAGHSVMGPNRAEVGVGIRF